MASKPSISRIASVLRWMSCWGSSSPCKYGQCCWGYRASGAPGRTRVASKVPSNNPWVWFWQSLCLWLSFPCAWPLSKYCPMTFWGVRWIVHKPYNKSLFLTWSFKVSFWYMQIRIMPKWVSRFWVLFPNKKGGDRITSDALDMISVTRAGTDKAETWIAEPDRKIWNLDEC